MPTLTNRRWALCDVCMKGFTMSVEDFYAAIDYICPDCDQRRLKLYLLREELKSAAKYGHQGGQDCALCAIQNQIDDLLTGGYDWREDYERRVSDSVVGTN